MDDLYHQLADLAFRFAEARTNHDVFLVSKQIKELLKDDQSTFDAWRDLVKEIVESQANDETITLADAVARLREIRQTRLGRINGQT